ncbi:MAG: RNA-binding protein [Bacteroidetes bacterium]|nr:RNA-binding protein [Bacteroidota bacterium]
MTIFVSKLNDSTHSDEQKKVFDVFGSVNSAQVVINNLTGKSRGFGFVEMESEDEATTAIQDLQNSELNGRTITVKKAQPQV